jgi:hypothetical protein
MFPRLLSHTTPLQLGEGAPETCRHLSMEDKHKVQASETLLQLAMILRMVRRLVRDIACFFKHALNIGR